jgi:hypothetical protein
VFIWKVYGFPKVSFVIREVRAKNTPQLIYQPLAVIKKPINMKKTLFILIVLIVSCKSPNNETSESNQLN